MMNISVEKKPSFMLSLSNNLIMDEKKCKDCGIDDVYVTINASNEKTESYQCFECYYEQVEQYKGLED